MTDGTRTNSNREASMTDTNHKERTEVQGDQPQRNKYQTAFNPDHDTVSETLLRAVATLDDTEPENLPLLFDYVDPDALDAFFHSHIDREKNSSTCAIFFEYNGYDVCIRSDGSLVLSSPPESSIT